MVLAARLFLIAQAYPHGILKNLALMKRGAIEIKVPSSVMRFNFTCRLES